MPAKQGTEREEKGNLKETFQDETLTVAEIELACASPCAAVVSFQQIFEDDSMMPAASTHFNMHGNDGISRPMHTSRGRGAAAASVRSLSKLMYPAHGAESAALRPLRLTTS